MQVQQILQESTNAVENLTVSRTANAQAQYDNLAVAANSYGHSDGTKVTFEGTSVEYMPERLSLAETQGLRTELNTMQYEQSAQE